jgi:MFS family permease
MLRPMVDPAQPTDPAPPPEPPETPEADAAPTVGAPSEAVREYVLPTARKVVSSGLQLALTSSSDLRRASIYIGLLVLGAFGPTVVGVLLILGRLGDRAGDILASVFLGEAFAGPPQAGPALHAALLIVALEALVGLVLFIAVSVDAQVMGIAILGGRAADKPMRLWEAILRARQAFWRMLGAGTVVGLASGVIQALILGAVGGLSQSEEASSVIAALIATILVAPLAYVSTSIVIGDVGAMEALSRSWRLFRVRRGLAIVVVLFTLLTSAIQLFAMSAGLDLVTRAADLLHLSLTSGAVAFTTALVLVLVSVVAYGSLTFTIAAVVSAPQVAGFLGLTYYSAGLDRARSDGAGPPRGFRYVTRPMLVAIIALAGVVGLEIPAINSIPQPQTSSLVQLVRDEAAAESDLIDVSGYPLVVDDAPADVTNPGTGGGSLSGTAGDITLAEAAWLGEVPDWLLGRFDCEDPNVACDGLAREPNPFGDGAYLFLMRAGAPIDAANVGAASVLLSFEGEVTLFRRGGADAYGGASRIFTTTFGPSPTLEAFRSGGDRLHAWSTTARSMWVGSDLYTLVPAIDAELDPLGWDVVTFAGAAGAGGADTLRDVWDTPLRAWDDDAAIFIDDYR